MRSIDYEDLKGMSRSDVNERLAKEQVNLREGDPLDLGELARLEHVIEEMYREKGYRFAEATYRLEEVSPTERRVVVRIDEAEKVRIGKIQLRRQRGARRLAPEVDDEEDQGDRPLHADVPARTSTTRPRSRKTCRKSATSTVRSATRTQWSSDPKLSVIQERLEAPPGGRHPGRGGRALEARRDPRSRATSCSTKEALLAKFKRPQGRLAARQDRSTTDSTRCATQYKNFGHIMAEVRGRSRGT